jgi:hypothetical protein
MSVDLSSLGSIKFKGSSNNTLTLSAPNVPADETLTLGNVRVAPVVAAASTINAGQSGSIIPVSCGGVAGAITLPTATAGLNYRFIISVAGAKDMVLTRAGADTFEGYLIGSATVKACAGAKSITLTSAQLLVGDSIDLVCYILLVNGQLEVLLKLLALLFLLLNWFFWYSTLIYYF